THAGQAKTSRSVGLGAAGPRVEPEDDERGEVERPERTAWVEYQHTRQLGWRPSIYASSSSGSTRGPATADISPRRSFIPTAFLREAPLSPHLPVHLNLRRLESHCDPGAQQFGEKHP